MFPQETVLKALQQYLFVSSDDMLVVIAALLNGYF